MASKYAGIVQDELRDLRGNAMQGAVVIVRELGTTTPATVYNNPVLIASAAGGDSLINDAVTGLPAASGLLQPGIDANGNYTFYADADVSYDLRVLWQGNTFDYRVRPKVVDEAYTSTADLTAALSGTLVEVPVGIQDGEVPTWDADTETWIRGTGGGVESADLLDQPVAGAVTDDDVFVGVDDPGGTPAVKQIPFSVIKAAILAASPGIPATLFDAAGDLIVASAADTAARLAKGTPLQVLRVNAAGTALEWAPRVEGTTGLVLAESSADVTVVNDSVETDVATLAIPGALVAAGDLVRLTCHGSFLNNTGGVVTLIFKIKIGATTVVATGAASYAASADRRTVSIDARIAIASTTAQRVAALLIAANATAAGGWTTVAGTYLGHGSAAEDTATAKNVVVTAKMGSANPLAEFVLHAARLEYVKKS